MQPTALETTDFKGLWLALISALVVVLTVACAQGDSSRVPGDGAEALAAEPLGPCVAPWRTKNARGVRDLLAKATTPRRSQWLGYEPAQATYVFDAGGAKETDHCYGVWREGRPVAFRRLDDEPVLPGGIFGYFFSRDVTSRTDHGLTVRHRQGDQLRSWLEELGVERAVVLEVVPSQIPFEIPPLYVVQLAIHEAFHLEVQIQHWIDGTGRWPDWDAQANRGQTMACYGEANVLTESFLAERTALVGAITDLLDDERPAACKGLRDFAIFRAERYAGSSVEVTLADGSVGTCAEAEPAIEVVEGIADWASWPWLYELGLATREQLLRRYETQQPGQFYLTGAMMLHAIELLEPERFEVTLAELVDSEGLGDGALAVLLEEAVHRVCE